MRNLIDAIWPTDGSIKTILDVGCGDLWFTERLPGVDKHVGIDIHQPAIDKAKAKNVPGFTGLCMDLREYMRLLPDNSFDAVLGIDVVEHFDEDGFHWVLSEMIRVASQLVVVWTTLGYIEQGPVSNDGEPNEYQRHLYGPTVEDFEGWEVDTYPDWHGARGGAIFAVKRIKPQKNQIPSYLLPGAE